jgi:hypothetical protein
MAALTFENQVCDLDAVHDFLGGRDGIGFLQGVQFVGGGRPHPLTMLEEILLMALQRPDGAGNNQPDATSVTQLIGNMRFNTLVGPAGYPAGASDTEDKIIQILRTPPLTENYGEFRDTGPLRPQPGRGINEAAHRVTRLEQFKGFKKWLMREDATDETMYAIIDMTPGTFGAMGRESQDLQLIVTPQSILDSASTQLGATPDLERMIISKEKAKAGKKLGFLSNIYTSFTDPDSETIFTSRNNCFSRGQGVMFAHRINHFDFNGKNIDYAIAVGGVSKAVANLTSQSAGTSLAALATAMVRDYALQNHYTSSQDRLNPIEEKMGRQLTSMLKPHMLDLITPLTTSDIPLLLKAYIYMDIKGCGDGDQVQVAEYAYRNSIYKGRVCFITGDRLAFARAVFRGIPAVLTHANSNAGEDLLFRPRAPEAPVPSAITSEIAGAAVGVVQQILTNIRSVPAPIDDIIETALTDKAPHEIMAGGGDAEEDWSLEEIPDYNENICLGMAFDLRQRITNASGRASGIYQMSSFLKYFSDVINATKYPPTRNTDILKIIESATKILFKAIPALGNDFSKILPTFLASISSLIGEAPSIIGSLRSMLLEDSQIYAVKNYQCVYAGELLTGDKSSVAYITLILLTHAERNNGNTLSFMTLEELTKRTNVQAEGAAGVTPAHIKASLLRDSVYIFYTVVKLLKSPAFIFKLFGETLNNTYELIKLLYILGLTGKGGEYMGAIGSKMGNNSLTDDKITALGMAKILYDAAAAANELPTDVELKANVDAQELVAAGAAGGRRKSNRRHKTQKRKTQKRKQQRKKTRKFSKK